MNLDYNSSGSVAAFLRDNGIRLHKRFGQNFLIEPRFRRQIIDALDPDSGETVWEIGPGIGALTHMLAILDIHLILFEIDYGLIRILQQIFKPIERLSIIEGDFLRTWEKTCLENRPDKIIGNLPYSSGSLMIGDLVKQDIACDRMVFTLQKEVIDRMVAQPGTSDYSAFSMVCQHKWILSKKGIIPSGAFFPRPDVTSAFIVMDRDPDSWHLERNIYDCFVNDIFLSRRKTIRNNLKQGNLKNVFVIDQILNACEQASLSVDRRGETVSVDEALDVCTKLSVNV